MKRITHLMLALTLVVFSLSSLAKEQEWPEITEDGLQRVHDARLAVVYITPGADLGVYGKVMISEPSVAFKKNWDRDMRSRSASKLSTSSRVNTTKIRKDLAQEFETVFTDKLSSGGYDVVTEAGDDVLLISPAIVNLDINAPQTSGAGRTNQYVRSAGEMTLYLELYDSVTGDLIAKALDRQVDREHNEVMTWANSSTNKAAAERILNGWADILLEALNEAKAYPNPEAPASE
jgi:hypothetical protein